MTEQNLKATLQHDLHAAMKQRDQVRSGTLRMALAAVTNAEVAGSEAKELTDAEVLAVIVKEAKKRKEAVTAYTDAKRPELAEQESAELAVLETYLPAQLDDTELESIVAEVVAETGATSMAQMGQVMGAAKKKVGDRADGGRVAAAVKKALGAS